MDSRRALAKRSPTRSCRSPPLVSSMDRKMATAVFTGVAAVASSLGLAACAHSSFQTTCMPATPASAMATHGSLEVRELRRDVATIISSSNKELETLATGDPGNSGSISQAFANEVSLMAAQLAALHYPPHYQSASRAIVTKAQSLAASLRSGQSDTNVGSALVAAVSASQRFYKLLGIPSVCTTTSG
jgi:poly(3-hydroxybutyrate) depolymerase